MRGEQPRRVSTRWSSCGAAASEAKVAATRGYGAAVDLEAADPREAFERLDVLLEETGRTLVHPFDDPRDDRGAGNGRARDPGGPPRRRDDRRPDRRRRAHLGRRDRRRGLARVIGVEPEGSTALHSALAAGERVEVTPTSIADGLNAPHAGGTRWRSRRERVEEVVLVTEEEIEEGFRFLYERAKLACEPAGAAAVAAVLAGKVEAAAVRSASSRAATSPPKTAAGILASR